MKRKIALWMVFIFVLAFMLSACGGKREQAKSEKAKADEAAKAAEAGSTDSVIFFQWLSQLLLGLLV